MPRRVRGEGSISAEGGRWVAQLSWTDSAGKRHRPKLRARTRREAAVLLDELRRQRDGGGLRKPETTSRERVEAWLKRWLTLYVEPTARRQTVTTYRYQVRTHIVPALGSVQLHRLGAERIQNLFTAMREQGYAASTVHQTRRVLHAALERAVKLRILQWNPVDGTLPPSGDRREAHALAAAEVTRLLERTGSSRYAALYALTVAVGLRQAEALGLRWQDIDLEAGELHVRGQLGRMPGGALGHVPVKTAAASRAVALPQLAIRALRDRAVAQAFEAERAGPLWEDHGLVFTTERGRPLIARNVYRSYKADVAAAGFPDLTFHDLRHTAISLMATGGVHQRVVMQVVGHTKASLTTELYTHVGVDFQRTAAEAIDAALGTTKGTRRTRRSGKSPEEPRFEG